MVRVSLMVTHSPLDGVLPRPQNKSVRFLPENEVEVMRLLLQHRYFSEQMGGLLPASLDFSRVSRVLDVACGVGGWVLDMARTHPMMQVIGIDKSEFFITQARRMAQREEMSNATFLVQDMHHLEGEDFAPETFDLIHLRFLAGEVTPQECPPLLAALVRLCKPEGLLVWTECELPMTNSPACEQLSAMVLRGLQAAGRAFSPGSSLGITAPMRSWLSNAGCHVIQDSAAVLDISAGTPFHRSSFHQAQVFAHQVRPFLLAMEVTTETEFEEVYRGMQQEMRAETFCGLRYLRRVVEVKGREDDPPGPL